MRRYAVLVVAVMLFAVGACSSSKKTNPAPGGSPSLTVEGATADMPWPAPPNPLDLARKAGLVPETHESLQHHVHAHLDVFVNGKPILVPAGIGINITDPAVHHAPDQTGHESYGGISPPCKQVCISPLHTHDVSGVIHTESSTNKDNLLGQFFTEWNVKVTSTCFAQYCSPKTPVKFYVNGQPFTGDPNTIVLSDLKEIAIVIGTPAPSQIPSEFPTQ